MKCFSIILNTFKECGSHNTEIPNRLLPNVPWHVIIKIRFANCCSFELVYTTAILPTIIRMFMSVCKNYITERHRGHCPIPLLPLFRDWTLNSLQQVVDGCLRFFFNDSTNTEQLLNLLAN